MKTVRQFMRQVVSWAAGKYAEPESRAQLREKFLDQLRTIRGEQLDTLHGQAEAANATPHQRVLKVKQFIEDLT